MGSSFQILPGKDPKMRLPVQVVLCVFLSILIQQDRMKGNAKPTTTPLKEDRESYDLTDESLQLTVADKTSQKAVKLENTSKLPLWTVLLKIVDKLSKNKIEFQNKLKKMNNQLVSLKDKLQGQIKGVHGDLVDMQNANSALCAYQNLVGQGNNGLSGNIVVYGTTYFETNGASCSLDKSTGKFTAGKSGVYQISVSAQYGHTNGRYNFQVHLRTSSGKYQDEAMIAYQYFDGEPYIKTPLSAIRFISLQQGETAWLEYSCSDGLASHNCYIIALKLCVSLYK